MSTTKTPRTDERFPPGFEDYNPADRDLCEELELELESLRAANSKDLQNCLNAMHDAIFILECGDKPPPMSPTRSSFPTKCGEPKQF